MPEENKVILYMMIEITPYAPLAFLVALALGLFYNYVYTPLPEIVYKYPTPFNVDKVTYQDSLNNCYQYTLVDSPCN